MLKYICPCCEHYTFDERPGKTYSICPVCFWEDDRKQYTDFDEEDGANRISLRKARENYQSFGACEEKYIPYVRVPEEDEFEGMDWRTLDV